MAGVSFHYKTTTLVQNLISVIKISNIIYLALALILSKVSLYTILKSWFSVYNTNIKKDTTTHYSRELLTKKQLTSVATQLGCCKSKPSGTYALTNHEYFTRVALGDLLSGRAQELTTA